MYQSILFLFIVLVLVSACENPRPLSIYAIDQAPTFPINVEEIKRAALKMVYKHSPDSYSLGHAKVLKTLCGLEQEGCLSMVYVWPPAKNNFSPNLYCGNQGFIVTVAVYADGRIEAKPINQSQSGFCSDGLIDDPCGYGEPAPYPQCSHSTS